MTDSLHGERNLRYPPFGGLYSKEGDHGHGAVVVVEGLPLPGPHVDLRRRAVVQGEHEVLAPGLGLSQGGYSKCITLACQEPVCFGGE